MLTFLSLPAGCEYAESEVCRYYVQQELDSANYQSAIELLDDINCQATYPQNEFYVDLGAAYLGKAGLTLPKVMSAMIEKSDDASSNQFATFIKEITNSASDTSLIDLANSRSAFTNYLDGQECKDLVDPSSTEDDVCLLTAFVDIVKTTIAVNSMTDGNINDWINDAEGNNPAMLRSTCALKYSYDHKYDSEFTIPYMKCEEGVSVDNSEFVTFTASDNTTQDYNSLTVSYLGENGYFLESEEVGSTIFTKGYCQIDYAACDDASVQGCFACPDNQGAEALILKEFVLDSLNNSFDNIETLITNVGSDNDDELKQAVNYFEHEIKSNGCEQITEGEDCFSMDDVINYLNKN